MKVRVLRTFNDVKGNKIRKKGEVFEVTKKRYDEINSTSYGILIEEIKGAKKNE